MCQDSIFLYGDCIDEHHHAFYMSLGSRTLLDIVSPRHDSPEIRRMCTERLHECQRTGVWRWCKKEDRAKRFLKENMLPNIDHESPLERIARRNSLINDGFMLAGGCYQRVCKTRTDSISDEDWSRPKGLFEHLIRSDLARRVQDMNIPADNYTHAYKRVFNSPQYMLVRHHQNGDLEKVKDDSLSSNGS